MFGTGLGNLAVGYVKVVAAGGVEIGSDGILTPLALYGAFSASGNFAASSMQMTGSLFAANPAPYNQGATIAAAVTSVSGLYKLVSTGGNINAAGDAARTEGIYLFALRPALTGQPPTLPGAYDGAKKIYDDSTSGSRTPGC